MKFAPLVIALAMALARERPCTFTTLPQTPSTGEPPYLSQSKRPIMRFIAGSIKKHPIFGSMWCLYSSLSWLWMSSPSPSPNLMTTLPVKPSQTTTSDMPFGMSLPSA